MKRRGPVLKTNKSLFVRYLVSLQQCSSTYWRLLLVSINLRPIKSIGYQYKENNWLTGVNLCCAPGPAASPPHQTTHLYCRMTDLTLPFSWTSTFQICGCKNSYQQGPSIFYEVSPLHNNSICFFVWINLNWIEWLWEFVWSLRGQGQTLAFRQLYNRRIMKAVCCLSWIRQFSTFRYISNFMCT